MNEFDRLLELELKRMLDPVVRTPVPPRPGRLGPLLKLYVGPGASIGPAASMVVLSDPMPEREQPGPPPELAVVPAPAS